MKLYYLFRCGMIALSSAIFAEKIQYSFTHDPIDVVIPSHVKDKDKLEIVIAHIKKNIPHNKIFVVSSVSLTESAEWISEQLFPFTKHDIALEIFSDTHKAEQFCASNSRINWIFQQLIKLYSAFVIPNISSNVLIVDADTVFLKPLSFLQDSGAGIFTTGTEYHAPYFEHAARLIKSFRKNHSSSGIVHHMLFQRCVLKDLFGVIEAQHGVEPWKALCRAIDLEHVYKSSLSEYEIYFNFAIGRSDQFKIRSLRWTNLDQGSIASMSAYERDGYDFVSCHTFIPYGS